MHDLIKNKKFNELIIWGTGACTESFMKSYPELNVSFFMDNNPKRWNNFHMGKEILPPPANYDNEKSNKHIIVCSEYFPEINKQLMDLGYAYGKDFTNYEDYLINDVNNFIISFPKCGRTWLRTIIGRIYQNHYNLDETNLLYLTDAPISLTNDFPVILAYHDQHPQHLKSKANVNHEKSRYKNKNIVFLLRNPHDTLLSLYYHMRYRAKNTSLSLTDFIRTKTEIIIEYYNSWINNQSLFNRFEIVQYEKLHKDPFGEVKKALSIFNPNENIQDSIIQEAIEFSSFENMRKIEQKNIFGHDSLKSKCDDPNALKTRKGKIGTAKDELNIDDYNFIESKIQKYLDQRILKLFTNV